MFFRCLGPAVDLPLRFLRPLRFTGFRDVVSLFRLAVGTDNRRGWLHDVKLLFARVARIVLDTDLSFRVLRKTVFESLGEMRETANVRLDLRVGCLGAGVRSFAIARSSVMR